MDNILISGAASGIGAATTRLFHARGWKVGLLEINHAALASLAAELGAAGRRSCHKLSRGPADLTREHYPEGDGSGHSL